MPHPNRPQRLDNQHQEQAEMNIHQVLDWRYAVREFSPRTLDGKAVEALLDATRKSASSYGLQPYKMLLIESESTRMALLPHSYGQQKVVSCSHLLVFAAHTDIGNATVDRYVKQCMKIRGQTLSELEGYANHMKQALAAKTPAEKRAWAHQQVHIALGTLLVAAASMQIDSCPMTGFDPKGYDQVLGLEERGLESSVVVALGYRSASDNSAHQKKVRMDYSEMVEAISE
ncbi:MAG: NAD(P)H-dependent oxidoreductase [Gammaproteobacteria bacterium]